MPNKPERIADIAYHDLISPEETIEVKKRLREFAERVVAPVSNRIAQQDESVENFPRDVFDAMAEEGLFKIPFAGTYGGEGLKYPVLATATAIEELAYHSNSIAAVFDVHCILAGRTLEQGSEELQEEFLRPLIKGEKIGSFATTEPMASTDLSPKALKTKAVKEGDSYIVSGQKRYITNAPVADFVTMLVNVEAEGPTELLIEYGQQGVTRSKPDLKLGNRGQLTGDIYLDKVRVHESRRIGKPGKGLHIGLATLTYGRVGVGAAGVGMAQCAYDHAMAHLKTREAFGRKLGAFQHWQFKMAERATELENARNLYLKAAYRMDSGIEFPEPESAMAKYYGTELSVDMARDAIQILGGYGFTRELAHDGSTYKVEEIYRDSKIGEIYEGTNEIQRMIIARTLFGKELVG